MSGNILFLGNKIFEIPLFFQTRPGDLGKKVHACSIRFSALNIKGHVETGYLTKFGALKLNRDQVMTLETWLKIHTNVCNFVTVSPKTI